MTREEILGMEVGRDLDSLTAEKVMGWKVVSLRHCWQMPNGEVRTHEQTPYKRFRPSIDIEAAWEVFEKFGWQGQVGYSGGSYFCEIMNGWDKNGFVIYGKAEECSTAPEAIVKAALLAIVESTDGEGGVR